MMVIFVSQCEKNSLKKTRRVLDSFANRIGNRTWQTLITQEGLLAVKKLLRKNASKNTAVACHWIHGKTQTELAWIVGNRDKFNSQGVVPVNYTQKTIMNTQWENDWYYLPLIKCLCAIAALFHDFGKASACFQEKLHSDRKNKYQGDPIRHEWISVLLFTAFVNNESDDKWLERLKNGEVDETIINHAVAQKKENPISNLPPVAGLVAWLIVSHHKLPLTDKYDEWRFESAPTLSVMLKRISQEWGYENRLDEKNFQKRVSLCFDFSRGLPFRSMPLLKQIKKWAGKLLENIPMLNRALDSGSWRLVLYYSRLAMMLGDHYYSSQDKATQSVLSNDLFANTDKVTGFAKQKLDEHLLGVSKSALNVVHLLPAFESELPRVYDIKSLKKKSPLSFKWQDKVIDRINKWKNSIPESCKEKANGLFAVNMASTGCGKTFANAKVMQALSDNGESLRFVLALGLRTLTLQTGDEYRDRIGLDNSELAVLIGSKSVLELHEKNKNDMNETELAESEEIGSEITEMLLDDDTIDYECSIPEDKLSTVLTQERYRKFLYAPVLACTIDHLMSATECIRGGRYILPALRLMSSDLVIDEIDDFDGKDLIAIGRLIHLAGMLGRKVMISSATIPPDMAQGYFNVYREGWQLFANSRDVSKNIGCVWIDEFNTRVETISDLSVANALDCYKDLHGEFIDKRIKNLIGAPVKRKAEIISCAEIIKMNIANSEIISSDQKQTIKSAYFHIIQQAIIEKHKNHYSIDPVTKKRVSFGVVRVANISPCIELTEYLAETSWSEDIEIRIMAYHSNQVLLLRSEQEKHLDYVLKRKEKQGEIPAAFKNHIIRNHIDRISAKNIIFILVATPVEEVGRDHDFDWAVVEPSSFRSIIQLSGRILRHRNIVPETPNVALMQYNIKGLENRIGVPAYCNPGYEKIVPDDKRFLFSTHDLEQLIDEKLFKTGITALPRIQRSDVLKSTENLADLEHFSVSQLLTAFDKEGPDSLQGWLSGCWWLTALPQQLNRFRESKPQVKLFLVMNGDEFVFMEKDKKGFPQKAEGLCYGIQHKEISGMALKRLWLYRDYGQLVETYSQQLDISKQLVALKYGEISLTIYNSFHEYRYSDHFGMLKV
jgi:CRISPR-associated endonuclease/helicase Cas3